MLFPLRETNRIPPAEFVRIVGPVFEHSPWIAERGVASRPFESIEAMHAALCEVVRAATEEEQLALIRAHPDLVGRAVLTAESQGEQSAAGLADLSAEEVALFDRYNREYKTRFGFPFVICARLISTEGVAELRAITKTDEAWHLGAAATLTAIEETLGGGLSSFGRMLRLFASRQIRSRATLGGNLATASPIGDSAPVLLSLDAALLLASESGERTVALAEFFTTTHAARR